MSKNDSKAEKIGPGNPPRHTQFQKGQSGNPQGRPKGRVNLQTIIDRILGKIVKVTEGGRRVTTQELLITSLAHEGIKGNYKATELLLRLAAATGVNDSSNTPSADVTTPNKETLRRIQQRLARLISEAQDR
jgi:Family of unknown function (DUF5681)